MHMSATLSLWGADRQNNLPSCGRSSKWWVKATWLSSFITQMWLHTVIVVWFCTDESQILYGIKPECPSAGRATVYGMPCDQELRDRFRVSFSKTISQQITPPISSDTITTHFWPVIDEASGKPVDDLFVIGIWFTVIAQQINAVFIFGILW